MNKYTITAAIGSLGALGSLHVYHGYWKPNQDGFLQYVEEDVTLKTQFYAWMAMHGKSYATDVEFEKRFQIFQNSMKAISDFEIAKNALRNIGNDVTEHELGLNQFADWTDEEYKSILGFKYDATKEQTKVEILESVELPDSLNWVTEGKVTPVKDQGTCGSCWSFSTTGSIESAYWIQNGSEILMSEQQLIDCSVDYGNNGCSGGLVEYGYHYATDVPLETEDQYPYKATNQKCQAKTLPGDIKLSDFKEVQRFDPNQLATALVKGPVSVGVDASGIAFKLYKKGIITRWCGDSIDHAVLLVGYGTDKGTDYWLIKNSWSTTWGEAGYFRVARDMKDTGTGMCGIQQTPSYPIL